MSHPISMMPLTSPATLSHILLSISFWLAQTTIALPQGYGGTTITLPHNASQPIDNKDANFIYPPDGSTYPVGTDNLNLQYYMRSDPSEFRLLPESSVEACTTDATNLLTNLITAHALDPATTYFDPSAPGPAGGKFTHATGIGDYGVGIRFNNSEDFGKCSLAMALKVLEAIGRAAEEEGFTETAVIVVWKKVPLRAMGYGIVDMVALEPGPESKGEGAQTS